MYSCEFLMTANKSCGCLFVSSVYRNRPTVPDGIAILLQRKEASAVHPSKVISFTPSKFALCLLHVWFWLELEKPLCQIVFAVFTFCHVNRNVMQRSPQQGQRWHSIPDRGSCLSAEQSGCHRCNIHAPTFFLHLMMDEKAATSGPHSGGLFTIRLPPLKCNTVLLDLAKEGGNQV